MRGGVERDMKGDSTFNIFIHHTLMLGMQWEAQVAVLAIDQQTAK